jgi:hypothetical protein
VGHHLTQTCTIERRTFSTSDYGGETEGPTLVITSDCYLTRATRSGGDMINAADQGRVFYMLHLPYDVDIEDGDEVVVDSERYRTEQVYRDQSVGVMRQALVVKEGS